MRKGGGKGCGDATERGTDVGTDVGADVGTDAGTDVGTDDCWGGPAEFPLPEPPDSSSDWVRSTNAVTVPARRWWW